MIFRRSIRWQLQAWHALLLTAVIAGFGITAHRLASSDRLQAVDLELQAFVAKLGIVVPPSMGTESAHRPPPKPGPSATDQITATGAHFIVWDTEGRVQAQSAHLPAGIERPASTQPGENTRMRTFNDMRQAVHFTGSGRCFIVGRPITRELTEMRRLGWYLASAGVAVLAFGLLGGWWMATRAIRPIAAISATAEKIATGTLSQRIPTTSEDELGRLAIVLNSTFSRLDAAFTQQARFSADAAHELRTPVTAVLMHAQNGLASDHLTAEQKEAFDACRRAAQRMKKLIDSLLELSRLDGGQEPMQHTPCDLAEVAHDCIDLVQTLAQAREVTIETRLDPAPCHGDAQRLGQVVINLLSNAIEHTKDHILITTRCESDHVTLLVTDNGHGIPPEHLPHLFERFYRADPSRQSSQHNGLGLAISKAIIEAHAGSLSARNTDNAGALFEVRLPLASQGLVQRS